MAHRSIVVKATVMVAAVALCALAFTMGNPAHQADAATGPACTFATPIPQLIQGGGGADTVTCTFDIHGTTHTFVGDFTVTLGATPPVAVTGCSLDGNVIHIGRCP